MIGSNDSLEETRRFWSKRAGRELTLEDAREIMENLYEFVQILMDWKREDDRKTAQVQDQGNTEDATGGQV